MKGPGPDDAPILDAAEGLLLPAAAVPAPPARFRWLRSDLATAGRRAGVALSVVAAGLVAVLLALPGDEDRDGRLRSAGPVPSTAPRAPVPRAQATVPPASQPAVNQLAPETTTGQPPDDPVPTAAPGTTGAARSIPTTRPASGGSPAAVRPAVPAAAPAPAPPPPPAPSPTPGPTQPPASSPFPAPTPPDAPIPPGQPSPTTTAPPPTTTPTVTTTTTPPQPPPGPPDPGPDPPPQGPPPTYPPPPTFTIPPSPDITWPPGQA